MVSPSTKRDEAPGRVLQRYAAGVAAVLVTTWLALWLFGRSRMADAALLYVLAVVLVSIRFGRGPSLLTAVLAVVAYDLAFVPPYYELAVDDPQNFVTFGVFLLVALVISSQHARLEAHSRRAREGEERTARLYAMSRALSAAQTREQLVHVAAEHLDEVFECRIAVLLPNADGLLESAGADAMSFFADEQELAVAAWVWTRHDAAGLGSDALPGARARYVLLRAAHTFTGVLAVMPEDRTRFDSSDQRDLLDAFGSQLALAVERARVRQRALPQTSPS